MSLCLEPTFQSSAGSRPTQAFRHCAAGIPVFLPLYVAQFTTLRCIDTIFIYFLKHNAYHRKQATKRTPQSLAAFATAAHCSTLTCSKTVVLPFGTNLATPRVQALLDATNDKFVMLSDTSVPLHRPATLYAQILSEPLSRMKGCNHNRTKISR